MEKKTLELDLSIHTFCLSIDLNFQPDASPGFLFDFKAQLSFF